LTAEKYEKEALGLLERVVEFPTVMPRDKEGLAACASSIEEMLREKGYEAHQFSTEGAPVVYAQKDVGASKTLMFYHHYDVQPEDPLEKWTSSPWKLVRRGERIYGRGTSDDKGPLICSIVAMELIEDVLGKSPVNVKFVVEGEEEAGSMNLPQFTREKEEFLAADGCIWEGAGGIKGSPGEVICGLKGDVYFELQAKGRPHFPRTDVHSGQAGAVPNAAWRLVWALSTLKDERENITIEGFNDLVTPPLREDIQALSEYKGDLAKSIKSDYDLDHLLLNRDGIELLTALYLKPALTICGIVGGYLGESDMTIIPASANAKIDVRLVPNLTVKDVDRLLKEHLKKKGFGDIQVKLTTGYNPGKTPVTHPFVKLVKSVTDEACAPESASVVPMAAGSGPAYLFTKHSPLALPLSYADSEGTNAHAPDENTRIDSVTSSIAVIAAIAERLGKGE
jgi:acetylornithine deacetylase/succinyl-diaminopimelate desuccinylase-like protein